MTSDQKQANSHYNVDLHILPEKGSLQAKVELFYSVLEKPNCYLEFYLHKGMRIRTVNGNVPLNYRFDVDHPFSFTPGSHILGIELKRPLEENELLRLNFEYEGNIGLTTFEVNRITPSWVELGLYSPWFPWQPNLGQFSYDVRLQIDPSYEVVGLGKVDRLDKGLWHISQSQPSMDMIIMASNRFQRQRAVVDGLTVELSYVDETDWVAQDIFEKALETLRCYIEWFGPICGNEVKIIIAPRSEGGGYARTAFVVVTHIEAESYNKYKIRYLMNIAHECAHLWWTNAPFNSWEDWLNESFAEYSSLMAVRELFGMESFQNIIAEKHKRSEGMPPIKGIKRDDEKAFTVLYDKGCLVLYGLEQMVGKETFLKLLKQTTVQKVSSTEEFLQLVTREVGSEVAVQLDQMLTS